MGEEVKVVVPESVLKKRKREEEWALAKKQGLEAAKKKNAENRKLIYNRAKQYSEEYKEQEKELIRLKREAKLKGGFYVDPEAKLLFIIRIRGINAIDPKTKKILQLLRLRQLFPRVNSDVDKSNSSSSVPELIMVQEVWFPFVFSSENASRERGAANNSEGPVDSSGFQLLIQDLADATDEGSFNLLVIVCRYHELGSSERVFIEHASDLLGTKLPSILEFACVVRFNGMNDGFA